MTQNEKLEWKNKALEVIKEYLKNTINYPNCENNLIMNHVPKMWELLGKKRLIQPGMTYNAFVRAANQKFM